LFASLFAARVARSVFLRRSTLPNSIGNADALDALNQNLRQPDSGPKRGTFGWLARQYYKSVAFKSLPPVTQATRRGVIDACLPEPYRPGSDKTMGQYPAEILQAAHIRVVRHRKAGKPGAANNRLNTCPRCSHGPSKATTCLTTRYATLRKGGATEAQMNAVLWSPGSKMAGTYIKRANRGRLATDSAC
jgi:hypothetical protein